MQSEVVYSLNHDLTASIVFSHTLNFQKIYLHLHRFGPAFDAAASAAMLKFPDIDGITKVL